MLALPIFPGRRQPSIVGAGELNFCVRYGNRWTLTAISTNFIQLCFFYRVSLVRVSTIPHSRTSVNW